MPIRQFLKKEDIWHEKIVNYNKKEDNFYYQIIPLNEKKLITKLNEYESSDIIEFSEQRENYFNDICKYIAQSTGTIIIIDYGYYDLPKHFTLQAVFNHKYSNLFENLGQQDITSLVNFKKLIEIAKKNRLNVDLYSSQKDFLVKNGIIERKNKIKKKCNIEQKEIIENDCARLINESQMGTTFKFLIVSSKKKNDTIQK